MRMICNGTVSVPSFSKGIIMRTSQFYALLTVLAMASVTTLRADEVLFKSGDRLTGTVKSVEGGKMTFESKVAGTLTLKMDDIKTFSTEKPIDIVLKSGDETAKITAAQSKDGQIVNASNDKDAIALDQIAKVNPPPVKWTGAVNAGATIIRGNTHSETATLGFNAARRSDIDRISAEGAYLFARQRDTKAHVNDTTADNLYVKGQYDFFVSKKGYLYGNLKFEKDRIADLERRFTPGLGYGYQWIESADINFKTEAGVSWIYEKYTDPEEVRTYLAGRLAYGFDWMITDDVKLYHNLEYIPSFERADTCLVNTDLGLQVALTSRLALDLKAQLLYNSQPAPGIDKLDTRYITALSWKF